MDSAFLELLGQVGATFISVVFSFFVGYLLYIRQQRDKIGNEIVSLKNEISSVIAKLQETPIPGVVQSLTSTVSESSPVDRLSSITSWTAGISWEMRVRVDRINEKEVWDRVRESLENLVRGVVPIVALAIPKEQIADSGYFVPKLEIVSESFRKWVKDFLKNTRDIEWFTREYAGHSWAKSFLEKMREWEVEHQNPVFKSQDVATLFERIMTLRGLVLKDLLLERNYESLRVDNFVSSYRAIVAGLLATGFFSVFMPLILLLSYPLDGRYYFWIGERLLSLEVSQIALVSLIGFILAIFSVTILLFRAALKKNE